MLFCVLHARILVMPATNAVSERSFSALRRIKSYLRAMSHVPREAESYHGSTCSQTPNRADLLY